MDTNLFTQLENIRKHKTTLILIGFLIIYLLIQIGISIYAAIKIDNDDLIPSNDMAGYLLVLTLGISWLVEIGVKILSYIIEFILYPLIVIIHTLICISKTRKQNTDDKNNVKRCKNSMIIGIIFSVLAVALWWFTVNTNLTGSEVKVVKQSILNIIYIESFVANITLIIQYLVSRYSLIKFKVTNYQRANVTGGEQSNELQ
jgi:hypothetical protein